MILLPDTNGGASTALPASNFKSAYRDITGNQGSLIGAKVYKSVTNTGEDFDLLPEL